jgi:DNA invertase Pin-like site-specific DNA recombinase
MLCFPPLTNTSWLSGRTRGARTAGASTARQVVATGSPRICAISLDLQRSRIEAICQAEGLQLEHVFIEEGVSGSKALSGRPEGSRLLEAAKRGDTVVALKLDRMFRNTADALDTVTAFNLRGVKLYLADMRGYIAGDAAGELHFSMLASFATFERRRISERITAMPSAIRRIGQCTAVATYHSAIARCVACSAS